MWSAYEVVYEQGETISVHHTRPPASNTPYRPVRLLIRQRLAAGRAVFPTKLGMGVEPVVMRVPPPGLSISGGACLVYLWHGARVHTPRTARGFRVWPSLHMCKGR